MGRRHEYSIQGTAGVWVRPGPHKGPAVMGPRTWCQQMLECRLVHLLGLNVAVMQAGASCGLLGLSVRWGCGSALCSYAPAVQAGASPVGCGACQSSWTCVVVTSTMVIL
jgi:hypothetical protein